MHARLVRFSLPPEKASVARAMAEDLPGRIAALPGCRSVTVFGDDEEGQYGIFVLWDSDVEANAAALVISPHLMGHLQGNVSGAPEMRLFPVLAAIEAPAVSA
jgi:heme-degrading monooxygenase HmoA